MQKAGGIWIWEVAVQASPPGAELEGVLERKERVSPLFRVGKSKQSPRAGVKGLAQGQYWAEPRSLSCPEHRTCLNCASRSQRGMNYSAPLSSVLSTLPLTP